MVCPVLGLYTVSGAGTGDVDYLYRLILSELVLLEDGERIQSPKRCVFKHKYEGLLDENSTMDNVQKRNIFINIQSSQTFRSYEDGSSRY
jgi:hypothetical protein